MLGNVGSRDRSHIIEYDNVSGYILEVIKIIRGFEKVGM
jgi:hypothetical protein